MSFRETCTLGIAAPDSFVTVPESDPPATCAFARTETKLRETHSTRAANGTSISLQFFLRFFGRISFRQIRALTARAPSSLPIPYGLPRRITSIIHLHVTSSDIHRAASRSKHLDGTTGS